MIGQVTARRIVEIPVASMFPSMLNPRRRRDHLKGLSRSMRELGLIHPLVARPASDGRFEIICGSRRWAAAQLAIDEGRAPADLTVSSGRSPARQTEVFEAMRKIGANWSAKEIRRRMSATSGASSTTAAPSFGSLGLTASSIGQCSREEAERLARLFTDLANGLPPGATIGSVHSPAEIAAAWERSSHA